MLSKEQIDSIIRNIYKGVFWTGSRLPEILYQSTAKHLFKGVQEGYESNLDDLKPNTEEYTFLKALKQNVYLFSAAKTFQYVLATEGVMVENNEVLSFSEFKTRALDINQKYNVDWLKSEYDTAKGQAQMGRKWEDMSKLKDHLPLVKFVTSHDAVVSDICRPLDGIIRPYNDPFWSFNSPLRHFRCRCLLQQLSEKEGKVTDISDRNIPQSAKGFGHNVFEDKKIFTKEHPYFDIPKKYKAFAKINFDLPLP